MLPAGSSQGAPARGVIEPCFGRFRSGAPFCGAPCVREMTEEGGRLCPPDLEHTAGEAGLVGCALIWTSQPPPPGRLARLAPMPPYRPQTGHFLRPIGLAGRGGYRFEPLITIAWVFSLLLNASAKAIAALRVAKEPSSMRLHLAEPNASDSTKGE